MKKRNLVTAACAAILTTTSTVAANPAGHLFTTFKGEADQDGEQVYFALSRDGRDWIALNNSQPILVSQIGEQGARDPYILRSHDNTKFYLIATDLSIYRNPDWKRAVEAGSHSILVWESPDLVNWSESRLVKVAPEDAGCTWAPEAVYDPEHRDYLVFWASTTKSDGFARHRIWAARTVDFKTFSAPFVYIEKPTAVIDTTIVRDGDTYNRFTKDEKHRAITMERSASVMGSWEEMPDFSLAKLVGYEGPASYRIEAATPGKPAEWCLILDNYTRGRGYQPYITRDLSSGQFEPAAGFNFPFRFRHGSVLPLTEEEYQRLQDAYGPGSP